MNSLVFYPYVCGCFTISTNCQPGFELMKLVGVPVRQKSVEFMCGPTGLEQIRSCYTGWLTAKPCFLLMLM